MPEIQIRTFRDRSGVCLLCHQSIGHTANCPVAALGEQVRDLTAQFGLFVADVSETLEAMSVIVSDRPPRHE